MRLVYTLYQALLFNYSGFIYFAIFWSTYYSTSLAYICLVSNNHTLFPSNDRLRSRPPATCLHVPPRVHRPLAPLQRHLLGALLHQAHGAPSRRGGRAIRRAAWRSRSNNRSISIKRQMRPRLQRHGLDWSGEGPIYAGSQAEQGRASAWFPCGHP